MWRDNPDILNRLVALGDIEPLGKVERLSDRADLFALAEGGEPSLSSLLPELEGVRSDIIAGRTWVMLAPKGEFLTFLDRRCWKRLCKASESASPYAYLPICDCTIHGRRRRGFLIPHAVDPVDPDKRGVDDQIIVAFAPVAHCKRVPAAPLTTEVGWRQLLSGPLTLGSELEPIQAEALLIDEGLASRLSASSFVIDGRMVRGPRYAPPKEPVLSLQERQRIISADGTLQLLELGLKEMKKVDHLNAWEHWLEGRRHKANFPAELTRLWPLDQTRLPRRLQAIARVLWFSTRQAAGAGLKGQPTVDREALLRLICLARHRNVGESSQWRPSIIARWVNRNWPVGVAVDDELGRAVTSLIVPEGKTLGGKQGAVRPGKAARTKVSAPLKSLNRIRKN